MSVEVWKKKIKYYTECCALRRLQRELKEHSALSPISVGQLQIYSQTLPGCTYTSGFSYKYFEFRPNPIWYIMLKCVQIRINIQSTVSVLNCDKETCYIWYIEGSSILKVFSNNFPCRNYKKHKPVCWGSRHWDLTIKQRQIQIIIPPLI